ncbi:MAG: MFS transporter, partial [Pontiellaceae bacterium]|nr:MFS transporter [Pontiellaceae bacterium]
MTGNKIRRVSLARLFGYSFGEGAVSITMNGIANFAMLFYTQILGMDAKIAGIALSITVFWDAITDPMMGLVTDHTRSRYGRRLPYVLLGGLALALFFYLLWFLPGRFTDPTAIFWCVLLVNLLVRTALTVFMVPYTALGFEICPEYEDRSRLQGIRYFLNMLVNIVFGGCAWALFFKDSIGVDGERIDGTRIAGNFMTMGSVLAVAVVGLILICVWVTRVYAVDNRNQSREYGNKLEPLLDLVQILTDKLAWFVFGFLSIAMLAMLLTAQMQMFTFVNYMQFSALEKTFVHSGGMVAFALGSLGLSRLVNRFDKKPAAYIGIGLCVFGGLGLFGLFSSGLVAPRAILGGLPLGTILFGLLQACWWGGCGILVPLATS